MLINEIIGWVAMILILTAFYLNTRNILTSDSRKFLAMNFISGLFMSINSGYHQAYPSMAANIIWLFIASLGLFQRKQKKRNMISRHWKGIAYKERAEDYINHLQTDTFAQLKHIEGFAGASILSREVSNGIEFLIITRWSDFAAIKKFAGSEYEVAVVPAEVRSMMIEYDHLVSHYRIKSELTV